MPQRLILNVPEGTTHVIPFDQLTRMQVIVGTLGELRFPLLIRLGAVRAIKYQPVTVQAIHTELKRLVPHLTDRPVPGVAFLGESGAELGGYHGSEGEMTIARSDDARVSVTPDGIRVVLHLVPPPVGFRSAPDLESGWYACLFTSLRYGPEGTAGTRTPAMGGSGVPVQLPNLPALPPVTRWHHARVAGAPEVAAMQFTSTPAGVVFRDLLHALDAACLESLRLKRPLYVKTD